MLALCSKLAYYASIMLNALACLLCLKLCRHNRRRPSKWLTVRLRQLMKPFDVAGVPSIVVIVQIPLRRQAYLIFVWLEVELEVHLQLDPVDKLLKIIL